MPMVHERILMVAEVIYQQALTHFQAEEYKKAEFKASAAASPAVFVAGDNETPLNLRQRAWALAEAATKLVSDVWVATNERYGERFLSGKMKSMGRDEASFLLGDLVEAMNEVNSLPS